MSKHVNGRKKLREKSPLLTKAELSDFHKGSIDKPFFVEDLSFPVFPAEYRTEQQYCISTRSSSISLACEGEK